MFDNRFNNEKNYEPHFSDWKHRHFSSGPPRPHGHSPRHSRPPPFGPPPFIPPPSFGSPLPLGKEAFQDIRRFFVLMIISEYSDGITGYQLQEKFKFPRGSLIRTLEDLNNKGYLETRDEVKRGRHLKLYVITEEGKDYLEKLRNKWAVQFTIMSEMAPPEHYGKKFLKAVFEQRILEKLNDLESKEDALDFLGGIRLWIKSMIQRFEKRKVHLEEKRSILNDLIEITKNIKEFNHEKFKKLIKNSFKK